MLSPKNRYYFYIPVIISIVFIGGMFAGKFLPDNSSSIIINNKKCPYTNKLDAILGFIQEEYVDSVSKDELIEQSIPAILQNLDPHSVYLPAEIFSEVNEQLEGEFEGIGIEFNIQNDTVIVIHTISGGPSEKRGVLPGDRIVKIDTENVAGVNITNAGVIKKLKGKKGTAVNISVRRENFKSLIDFEIIRDKIPLRSVDASFMADSETGYIKVSKFARTTYDEFHQALQKLNQQGLKNIIVDLRGNSGGYLDAATLLADEFLKKGKLIVYTKGRSRKQHNIFATGEGLCEDTRIAVLIDEWSASASEIFAGAVQDNDRGTIIGRRSFGKGLVQEPVVFNDGSSLRLTVARYYTPTGRCIQRQYNKGGKDYYEDFAERFHNGEFESEENIIVNDSIKFVTPGGKVVYGGGGIIPDIFVPVDTSRFSEFYRIIANKSYIYQFALAYSDKNRKHLKNLKNSGEMNNFFDKENILNLFLEYCREKHNLTPSEEDLKKSSGIISLYLNAYIARNIFSDNEFYSIALQADEIYMKALLYFNAN